MGQGVEGFWKSNCPSTNRVDYQSSGIAAHDTDENACVIVTRLGHRTEGPCLCGNALCGGTRATIGFVD